MLTVISYRVEAIMDLVYIYFDYLCNKHKNCFCNKNILSILFYNERT